jgi:hypothetical protein
MSDAKTTIVALVIFALIIMFAKGYDMIKAKTSGGVIKQPTLLSVILGYFLMILSVFLFIFFMYSMLKRTEKSN